jgi:hypothetical protein
MEGGERDRTEQDKISSASTKRSRYLTSQYRGHWQCIPFRCCAPLSINEAFGIPKTALANSLHPFKPRTIMQRSINASYAAFYHDIALHPEVGRFRRFAAQFAKKLYDDTEEVLLKESAVNDALAQVWGRDRGVTVLDVPRSFVEANCAKDPEIVKNLRLKEQWNSYEQALVKYGKLTWRISRVEAP